MEKLYCGFPESRHTEKAPTARPRRATKRLFCLRHRRRRRHHAHVFRQGLALADTRQATPRTTTPRAGRVLALLDEHGLGHGVLVQPVSWARTTATCSRRCAFPPPVACAAWRRRRAPPRETLQAMAEAGVTGIRLNLIGLPAGDPGARVAGPAGPRERAGLARELHLPATRLPDLLPALLAAGCRVVVDHFGRPDPRWARPTPASTSCCGRRKADAWVKPSALQLAGLRLRRIGPPGRAAAAGGLHPRTAHVGQRLAPYRAPPPGVLLRGNAMAGRLDRRPPRSDASCLPTPRRGCSRIQGDTMTHLVQTTARAPRRPVRRRRPACQRAGAASAACPERAAAGRDLSARRTVDGGAPDRPQAGRRAVAAW